MRGGNVSDSYFFFFTLAKNMECLTRSAFPLVIKRLVHADVKGNPN